MMRSIALALTLSLLALAAAPAQNPESLPGAVRSEAYAVTAGDRPLFVEHYKKLHIARVALAGKTQLTVTAHAAIATCRVSPEALGIKPQVQGRRLTFTLDHPAWLYLRINNGEPLCIFAEPPLKGAPDLSDPKVRNITASGVDATGQRAETARIQAAIDALPAGGVLYFPPGVYQTAMLRLKSEMTLWLAQGATLLGSTDLAGYPADKIGRRFLLIDGAHNIAIRGRGALDGNGRRLREATGDKAHLLTIVRSSDVRIEGIELRDAASWNTHIIGSNRVSVSGVKLISDPELANTDGFDPDASSDVAIDNCFVYCGDDGVAIKSTGRDGLARDVKNIAVRRSVFLTRKSALKVGTESCTARMGDVTFADNDVVQSDRGMAIYCNDGALYENIRYVGNRFEDCYPDAKQRMIDFSITERKGQGAIRNVLVQNCAFKTPFPKESTLAGLDAAHPIAGVRFENFTIGGKLCRSAADAGIKLGKGVEDVTFR